MLISEAVKKAMEQGKRIYRKGIWREKGFSKIFIEPTNLCDVCMAVKFTGRDEKASRSKWSPTGDDLMADDWELC